MGPIYFNGLKWNEITREERVFCAELDFAIRSNPDRFVEILKAEANLPKHLKGPWDTAYEACFYRDYLHKFRREDKSKYSSKRTFDLALFSDSAVIIIEAKAAELFTADQARYFKRDISDIKRLLGEHIQVVLVALATQVYFDNYEKYGRGTALDPFEGRFVSWESLAKHYPDFPLLKQACTVYKSSPLRIVESDSIPYWRDRNNAAGMIERLEAEIEQRRKIIDELKRKGST